LHAAFELGNVRSSFLKCGGDVNKHLGTSSNLILTMVLHPDTITAILNNWGAPKYDGSRRVRPWLGAIEELFRIYGIPPIQMTEMAVKCTTGQANPVLTAMFEAKVAEAGAWLWPDFKECVIQIEGEQSTSSVRSLYSPTATDNMRGQYLTFDNLELLC